MSAQTMAAWLVHLYTASGGVIGVFALFAAAEGEIRLAFLLLLLTTAIDATDGIMARKLEVSKRLPNFSGADMDNVIDVLTFVWVPVYIMGSQNLLPHLAWTIVPVVAALYAYGQVNMKTDDAFFLGFPSYWNVVALYMFWLRPEPALAVLMVIVPAILTFIPTRYLYPSKNPMFWKPTWLLGAVWFALITHMLLQENPNPNLILLSLFYPAYYMILSFYLDWRLRRHSAFA